MDNSRDRKQGSQGIGECDVAYQMGLHCPMGQEIVFILGLDRIWPDIHTRPEAKAAVLRGLSDRTSGVPLIPQESTDA